MALHLDSEFTDLLNPDLVSLAIVDDEDGERFHAVLEDFDPSFRSEFFMQAVEPKLGLFDPAIRPRSEIAEQLGLWLGCRAGTLDAPALILSDNAIDFFLLKELCPLPEGIKPSLYDRELDGSVKDAFFFEREKELASGPRHNSLHDALSAANAWKRVKP